MLHLWNEEGQQTYLLHLLKIILRPTIPENSMCFINVFGMSEGISKRKCILGNITFFGLEVTGKLDQNKFPNL